MSYRRSDVQTISGSVTGSVSYPASEKGGSTSVTLHWHESVRINVTVDDAPFNGGVATCKHHIDALTASVVATETAQLASRAQSADKIGETIVQGFFGLIKSEIAQQMTEIASSFSPKLQELNNFASRCIALREKMERDFHRIMDRYNRLFGDLDRELVLRIKSLDKAAFSLQEHSSDPTKDSGKTMTVTTPMVSGAEVQNGQSQLLAYTIRQRASAMIQSAHGHIESGEQLNVGLKGICAAESVDTPEIVFVPVVLIGQDELNGGQKMHAVSSRGCALEEPLKNQYQSLISMANKPDCWAPMTKEARVRLKEYLSRCIIKNADLSANEKSQREVALIQTLWNSMKISNLQGASL